MGDDRSYIVAHQLEHDTAAAERHYRVWKLDQDVWAPCNGRRALIVADVGDRGVSKTQLASQDHSRTAAEPPVQVVNLPGQKRRVMCRVESIVSVRRRHHDSNAIAGRQAAHLDRFIDVASAVIYTG
jgi:hypothetical protein